VEVITGLVNEVPVPKLVPPVDAAYQEIVPAEAVAPIVTAPVPQIAAGVVPVIVGAVLIVATTALLGEVHAPSEVSTK
jgi:hypothetical protein